MLCFVVIAEEIAAGRAAGPMARSPPSISWARASPPGLFGAVNILPYGWRALYFMGAVPIFLVGIPAPAPAGDKAFRNPG